MVFCAQRNRLFLPGLIFTILLCMITINILFHSNYIDRNSLRSFISKNIDQISNYDQYLPLIHQESKIEVKKQKIAYIFAGSARSWVCPKVHWSIRINAIDAFGDDPYVFVRISTDDNRNVQTGKGTLWKPPYEDNEVNETLKILAPKVIEYFSFENQVEEMKRNYPGWKHAVFRENDQRRYSMYYHRCMAYKLMLNYEKTHGIEFDWVVLIRLDAAWLEPVLPISSYFNDRVWITETGFDLFNDQFMLMPRKYSDYLYDLNTKVEKKVYCLGGPDVEKWKCNATELTKRGVSDIMKEKTLEACCKDRFTHNRLGASERIHFRHLKEGNIPVSTARFPVFLTRRRDDRTCFSECFRLYTYQYKEYLFRYDGLLYPLFMPPVFPDTRGRTISSRDKTVCVMMDHPNFYWNPISAHQLHTNNSNLQVDYNKKIYDNGPVLPNSLILDPKDMEVWRIRPTWNVDTCLTYCYKNVTLSWSNCRDHFVPHSLRYDPRQLFFLSVKPHHPSDFDFSLKPYTHDLTKDLNLSVPKITRLMITHANPADWEPRGGLRCITAVKRTDSSSWDGAKVVVEQCNFESKVSTDKVSTQFFLSVTGWTGGSHFQSTIGKLQLAVDPEYCIIRSDNVQEHPKLIVFVPLNDELIIRKCDFGGHLHQVLYEFQMIGS